MLISCGAIVSAVFKVLESQTILSFLPMQSSNEEPSSPHWQFFQKVFEFEEETFGNHHVYKSFHT